MANRLSTTGENTETPIVFPVAPNEALSIASRGLPEQRDYFGWRVLVRALSGLQKEALAFDPDGRAWRLASDEGVQLGGEEEYPCPLEYLSMGAAFSLLVQMEKLAERHDININSLRVGIDNAYSVDGSVLQGTVLSTAAPAAYGVHLETDAAAKVVQQLVQSAMASSPAEAYLRQTLTNVFDLHMNGERGDLPDVQQAEGSLEPQMWQPLAELAVTPAVAGAADLVNREASMPEGFCAETETLSAVQIEQHGEISVHAEAHLTADMAMEGLVQQCKPLVTGFRCRSAFPRLAGPRPAAPPPLAYLLTGMATCYITQLMRFAHLTKMPLKSAFIVQDNAFRRSGSAADWSRGIEAGPVGTHVFLETDGNEIQAQQAVAVAERMCFVHAIMRAALPSTVQIWRNGEQIG
jgi:uncharacterized OsmC-like protein